MAVVLVSSNKKERTIGSLEDGQIAIIIDDRHRGEIVQRYGDNCVVIGKRKGCGWTGCNNNSIEVRLLEDGELIEVIGNE